jgi:acyl transferase domain-containing protein
MYASYAELKAAHAAGQVSFDEYRRYFSRLLGTRNRGYPDFTDDKMAEITADAEAHARHVLGTSSDKPARASRRKPRTCVVVGETNGMNDIKSLVGVFVFDTRAKAMAFVRGVMEGQHGEYSSSTVMSAGGRTYFLVTEGDTDEYSKAFFP